MTTAEATDRKLERSRDLLELARENALFSAQLDRWARVGRVVRVVVVGTLAFVVASSIAFYNAIGWTGIASGLRTQLAASDACCEAGDALGRMTIESPTGHFAGRAPSPSDYPEPQFRADCDAVCESHWSSDPPGRTVMVDPEHLICVCFRPEAPWALTRYRAWAREQGE